MRGGFVSGGGFSLMRFTISLVERMIASCTICGTSEATSYVASANPSFMYSEMSCVIGGATHCAAMGRTDFQYSVQLLGGCAFGSGDIIFACSLVPFCSLLSRSLEKVNVRFAYKSASCAVWSVLCWSTEEGCAPKSIDVLRRYGSGSGVVGSGV